MNQFSGVVIDACQELAQKQEVALVHRPADSEPAAWVDSRQIAQVLNILVADAIRATRPQGAGDGLRWNRGCEWGHLGHNDLWDNETDYDGVSPGSSDLHIDPVFASPEPGEFRLFPHSPLVDAGTNLFVLDEDFEGEPRPWDGDGDSVSVIDIGADEYHAWLLYKYVLPIAARSAP